MTINPTTSTWLDVYDATGITPGTALIIQYESAFALAEFIVSSTPPAPEAEGLKSEPLRTIGSLLQFNPNDGELIYVRAVYGTPHLSVIESSSLTVGPVGIPPVLIVKRPGPDARLKCEDLAVNQQYIIDGFGYYANLIASSIESGAKAFFRVTVPSGFYMAVSNREITTNKERVTYRVYKPSSYTGFTPTTGVTAYNLRSDALTTSRTGIFTAGTLGVAPTQSNAIIVIPVFGFDGVGNTGAGGLTSDLTFKSFAPGEEVLIELHNESSTATYAQIDFTFALIPAEWVQAPIA